jgi:hypothetical protein
MAYQDLAQKLESLQAQKKAIRDKADAEIAAVKKGLAEKQAALRANERRLRAKTLKTQKQQDDHAKILIGVAMIWKCQQSPESAKKFRELLTEFYKNSPERLEAAEYGLALTVKRSESDENRDDGRKFAR